MHHRIEIIGYVGSDAKVSQVDDKNFVINFNLADSREYVDKNTGEETKKTQWFSCAYWFEKEPKVAEFIKKGTLLFVSGYVSSEVYLDRQDKPQAQIKVKVQELKLLKQPSPKEPANKLPQNFGEDPNSPF